MYVDGALCRNNPIRPLLDEAKQIWPSRPIGCVLSIGTGVALSTNVGRTLKPLMETLKSISTEAEETAREVEREMEHEHGLGKAYTSDSMFRMGFKRLGWKNGKS